LELVNHSHQLLGIFLFSELREVKVAIFTLLLGSVRLTERCHTDDLLPDLPVPCLPPRRVDSKVLGLNVIVDRSQQVVLGGPTGHLQSDGGRSAAEMT